MTDDFNTPIQPPIEPLPIEQPKKSNKTVWIIVIVVALLLCCCCVLAAVLAYLRCLIGSRRMVWSNTRDDAGIIPGSPDCFRLLAHPAFLDVPAPSY